MKKAEEIAVQGTIPHIRPDFTLGNFRPAAFLDLLRREPIAPMDALNLIDISNHDFYALYGILVLPLLKLIGSRLIVTLEHEEMLHGEKKFNHCLIARYQTHRHFLGMITNPYYLMINRAREAGVKYLELSFTKSRASLPGDDFRLGAEAELLLLRLKSPGDWTGLADGVRAHGLEAVYSSERVADLDIFAEAKATNPNPLEYPVSIFLRAGKSGAGLARSAHAWNTALAQGRLDYTLSLWKKTEFKEGILSGILKKLAGA